MYTGDRWRCAQNGVFVVTGYWPDGAPPHRHAWLAACCLHHYGSWAVNASCLSLACKCRTTASLKIMTPVTGWNLTSWTSILALCILGQCQVPSTLQWIAEASLSNAMRIILKLFWLDMCSEQCLIGQLHLYQSPLPLITPGF